MSAVSLIRGSLLKETKKSKAKKKGQRKKERAKTETDRKRLWGEREQSIFKVGRTIKHISTLNWPKHPH